VISINNFLGKWLKAPTLTEQLRTIGVREDIVKAAERTAFGRQSDRELPALEALLDDHEAVIQLLEGRHTGAVGLLVLTTQRLLFAPKHADRSTPTMVYLPDVMSVTWRMHRGLGVIEVAARWGDFMVDQILGKQAEWLGRSLQEALLPSSIEPKLHRDPLDELAELRALHRAGAIGDAEFQIRKHELFGQI
jgi:hypothetical protein